MVVFRDDNYSLLTQPFALNFITSPAVNAGVYKRFVSSDKMKAKEDETSPDEASATMRRRVRTILATALEHQQRCLILGAWGTGCFRNDPDEVAD